MQNIATHSKTLILSILFMASLTTANAQEWQTDIVHAKELAQERGHNIILVFQGSDWCAPCIKLEQEIWSTEEFKSYAKEHFVMLKADFPKRKKNALPEDQQEANNKLAEMYNKQGFFPFVVVLDEEGKVLGETGYKKVEPIEYINILNSF